MSQWSVAREVLDDLAPALRRAVSLDPRCVVRFRVNGGRATALIRLPFDVLVSRSVSTDAVVTLDAAVHAVEALRWLDTDDAPPPTAQDSLWRTGLPPERGWVRVETVPDDVIRPLVRSGALTLKAAADREGVPGAQPRAEVSDALLDSVVLTATTTATADDSVTSDATDETIAPVTLRALSALTRMGFLPSGGHAFIDAAGRWVRVVAEYGTVYLERPGSGLTVR